MRILCISLWKNSWITYWDKFLIDRGHKVEWLISNICKERLVKDYLSKFDAILSYWAIGWTGILTKMDLNIPLFVIHRSFEIYDDTKCKMRIEDIDWSKVHQLFMLNESHFKIFNEKVRNVHPIFIKNGIDIDYWKLESHKQQKKSHKVGWIANINHKKGEQLALHGIRAIQKIDSLVQLEHLGNIDSRRIFEYLENIAPYLKSVWYSYGCVKKHSFVKDFFKDKRYIYCSSLAEGHPMNLIEAMACGCQPLIHRYPGARYQWPEKWIWNDFDDLIRLYQENYKPEEYRQYIIDNYDYRKVYLPVIEAIENSI